ncbi:thiosulfate sulfurtransferase Tum1p [Monosporozyma unispora]|nr:hypothetical protein C6P44_000259 [Kazachstania unispora]
MSLLYKLITPREFIPLLKQTGANRVIPVDATWYLPNAGRNGKEEFLTQERIPGSIFFDIDGIKDTESPFPHMAPSKETFVKALNQFGILPSDTLVVYDRIGNFSAPRCAWTLALFGHPDVRLLNSFNVYKELNGPIEQGPVKGLSPYEPTDKYTVSEDLTQDQIVSFDEMTKLVEDGTFASGKIQLFDARSNGRFKGVDPEPRPGLTSGHVPGAQSLPFVGLLDATTKQFPSDPAAMKELVIETISKYNGKTKEQVSKDLAENQIYTMCGTGVTGAIIKTALEHAGYKNIKLYDGSWTEWALRNGNDSPLIAKDL